MNVDFGGFMKSHGVRMALKDARSERGRALSVPASCPCSKCLFGGEWRVLIGEAIPSIQGSPRELPQAGETDVRRASHTLHPCDKVGRCGLGSQVVLPTVLAAAGVAGIKD